MKYVLIYFIAVSIAAVLMTCIDKLQAKRGGARIPENALLFIGIIGGAFFEYVTMRIIHHKTRHSLFMTGLPIIIFLHFLAAALLYLKDTQLDLF
jgi:uncharacterized membrane protein YsdA (DUF1294 family)